MIGWSLQVQVFLRTMVLGLVLGLVFHFYWLLLRTARPSRRLITLTDILFCLFLLLFIGGTLLLINAGEVRFYVWLALFSGGWLYKAWLFAGLTPVLGKICRGTVRVGRWTLRLGQMILRSVRDCRQSVGKMWINRWKRGKTPPESPPEEEKPSA